MQLTIVMPVLCLEREVNRTVVHLVSEFPELDYRSFLQLSIAWLGNRGGEEPISCPVWPSIVG